jgi:hypothetical protein
MNTDKDLPQQTMLTQAVNSPKRFLIRVYQCPSVVNYLDSIF